MKRWAVFAVCIACLLTLLGCGNEKPFMRDGPGMEREIWSAFTIARCNERFESIYSYTVKYDEDSDEAYLHEGQAEENSIQLQGETVTALFNLNLMSLPDEEPLTGNFLGLSVFDSKGQAYPKRISSAMEDEILALINPYLDALKANGEEEPFMLDGPEMEYQSPWTAFTLSRADSNTRYSFWFSVIDNNDQALVMGECSDEKGNSYIEETGIEISAEDLWQLRWMNLDHLPEEEPWPEDLELPTDMANITLTLTLSDGTAEKKNISGDLSMEIYELLLPYLKNN